VPLCEGDAPLREPLEGYALVAEVVAVMSAVADRRSVQRVPGQIVSAGVPKLLPRDHVVDLYAASAVRRVIVDDAALVDGEHGHPEVEALLGERHATAWKRS
jgi:hypothetical protein